MNKFRKPILLIAALFTTITISATAFAADYTVVANDSLYKIGLLFNTPVNTIKSDNSLRSDTIYPGQVLQVPATVYTVKTGDTLFLIAQRYGISLSSLMKANNKYDSMLIPGQKLIIPNPKVTNPASTVISYTKEEVDLLARLIQAEAEGEEYNAMVGVGAVVVNRVQSKEWPNTITAVINHVSGGYVQFTPVKNGTINKPASDIAIKAAWAALYGNDPSKEAMFYFDDSSTNQWLWSKTITARIDHMVFVK